MQTDAISTTLGTAGGFLLVFVYDVFMQTVHRLTCVIHAENGGYVSLCPELDVASQGDTVEEARTNLVEALELFLESASSAEITERLHGEVYVTPIEVKVG